MQESIYQQQAASLTAILAPVHGDLKLQVMLAIYDRGPLTQAELYQCVDGSTATLSVMLRRWKREGLLDAPDGQQVRPQRFSLTERSRRAVEHVRALLAA